MDAPEPERTATGDEALSLGEGGLDMPQIQRLLFMRWRLWLKGQDGPRRRRVARRRKKKDMTHV